MKATATGERQLKARPVRWWVAVAGVALLVGANGARGLTPEDLCQRGLAKAAAKYAKCIRGLFAKDFGILLAVEKAGSCATKYAATWGKLQAKTLASPEVETCDAARFVDNGDGTVTDNLTGLQWEQKVNLDSIPNPGDPHDADNAYAWSDTGSAADGAVFTSFLTALNSACFAGHCDWRLATEAELLTIAQPAVPDCTVGPCIDPIFGPTVGSPDDGFYWSSITEARQPLWAYGVRFDVGVGVPGVKTGSSWGYVRAVRSGWW